MHKYHFVLLVLVSCIASGCRPGGTKVSGRVLLDGMGLENMNVLFQPVEAGRESASGMTDSEGRFVLKRLFDNAAAVEPGEYRVFICWRNTSTHSEFDKTPPAVCPYSIPLAAGCGNLVRKIESGGTQILEFELSELKDVPVELRKEE